MKEQALKNGIKMGFMHLSCKAYETKGKVLQCYNCQGYNHSQANCRKPQACLRCAGPHRVKDCPKPRDETKCANCNGNHHSTAKDCLIRQYAETEFKRKQQENQGNRSRRSSRNNSNQSSRANSPVVTKHRLVPPQVRRIQREELGYAAATRINSHPMNTVHPPQASRISAPMSPPCTMFQEKLQEILGGGENADITFTCILSILVNNALRRNNCNLSDLALELSIIVKKLIGADVKAEHIFKGVSAVINLDPKQTLNMPYHKQQHTSAPSTQATANPSCLS